MIDLMSTRRWSGPRSYSVLVLVLLMTATALTLIHWHKDWTGQGCELCHLRHLPTLHSPVADAPAVPIVAERKWHTDDPTYEPEVFSIARASRAPPPLCLVTV